MTASYQFCDTENNRDITGDFNADQDATEVRVVTENGYFAAAATRNSRHRWNISQCDNGCWVNMSHKSYNSWHEALYALVYASGEMDLLLEADANR